jgi:hypothetical protein
MLYGYETYKAQEKIYQTEGSESRLGEEYARNHPDDPKESAISLFSRLRAWFQNRMITHQSEETDSHAPTPHTSWIETLLHQRKRISVGE